MTDAAFLNEIQEEKFVASDEALKSISDLALTHIRLSGEADKVRAQLKVITDQIEKIEGTELPAAMQAAQMESFSLATGQKVTVKEELTCSVPAKRKAEVIAKLRADGHDDLITNEITVDVARGQDNLAGDLMGVAQDKGLLAKRAENVNTASLKKLLREQLDAGVTVDLPFYGAFLLRRAKISQ